MLTVFVLDSKVKAQSRVDAKKNPHIHRAINLDNFQEFDSPLATQALPAWKTALTKVQKSTSNIIDHRYFSTFHGYAFPPQKLFCSATEENALDLMLAWLVVRTSWISRIGNPDLAQAALPNPQQWRSFLRPIAIKLELTKLNPSVPPTTAPPSLLPFTSIMTSLISEPSTVLKMPSINNNLPPHGIPNYDHDDEYLLVIPRVNARLLERYIGRVVRLFCEIVSTSDCLVTKARTADRGYVYVTLQDGTIISEKYVVFVGTVTSSDSIDMISYQQLDGSEFNLDNINAVIEFLHDPCLIAGTYGEPPASSTSSTPPTSST
ncbi:hypothetical protein AN958_03195 [Leucoagaricus sp. SymC.cos]|nr:hypothetical protein AN958_03195 [Leucoagaricus sp. SymC.cos]